MVKPITTKVSTKYQIVIPKEIRKQMDLTPQDTFEVTLDKDGNILLKKRKKMSIFDLRGTFKYPKNYLKDLRKEWDRNF